MGVLSGKRKRNGWTGHRITGVGSDRDSGRAGPGGDPWAWKLQTYRLLVKAISFGSRASYHDGFAAKAAEPLTTNDIGLGGEGIHVPARKLLSAGQPGVLAGIADGRRHGLVRRIGINAGAHFGRLRVDD